MQMISFPINIDSGKIVDFDRQSFQNRLKFIGSGKYFLNISENRPNRTTQQNRYLWGCVYHIISQDTGYTAEEVHQIMADMFLKYEKNGREFVKSTTRLNTKEFSEYVEQIRRFASADLGIFIPDANEAGYAN